MMRSGDLHAVTLFLTLTACAAAVVVVDRGCAAYGEARATMPPLDGGPVSAWVAMLDTSMTRVCRQKP